MKRQTLFVVIMLLAVLFLCSFQADSAEFTLRSADVTRDGISHGLAQKFFAKRVDEITKGKVEIKTFLGGVLGNERTYLEQLQLGSLDFAKSMATNAVVFVPKFGVFGMPYLIRDLDHLYKIFDSPAGKMLGQEAEKAGFVILAYWDTGIENIYNSKKPIIKPEDLRGLKIRTREASICVETINAMGGIGSPVATPEVYSALQTKVVDGGVQSASAFTMVFKYAELCKFYSFTEQALENGFFLASKKRFDKLPRDIQDALRQAGRESMDYMHQTVSPAEEKEAVGLMQTKYGVKINKVDKEAFIKSVAPVQIKYKAEFGPELVDGIAKIVK